MLSAENMVVDHDVVKPKPLGRLGEPEDCANLVAFLCSAQARHITGTVITVDGGQYMA